MFLKNAPDELSRSVYKKVKKEWDRVSKKISFSDLNKLEAKFQNWLFNKKSDKESV